MTVKSTVLSVHNLHSMETLNIRYTPVSNEIAFPIDFILDPSCLSNLLINNLTSNVYIIEGKVSASN